MIISLEIENVEKVENWRESIWEKGEKSILRAFARTRAKNSNLQNRWIWQLLTIQKKIF